MVLVIGLVLSGHEAMGALVGYIIDYALVIIFRGGNI
jgi:hypothetical protein